MSSCLDEPHENKTVLTSSSWGCQRRGCKNKWRKEKQSCWNHVSTECESNFREILQILGKTKHIWSLPITRSEVNELGCKAISRWLCWQIANQKQTNQRQNHQVLIEVFFFLWPLSKKVSAATPILYNTAQGRGEGHPQD